MKARYWLNPIITSTWKEIRILTRYKTWLIATFLWPILFPLTFVVMGRGLAGRAGEGLAHFATLAGTKDFASFLLIGNLVWMFVNINLWFGGLSLKTERERGTFDTTWTTPVNRIAPVLGATLSSLIMNFLPMVVAILIYSGMGLMDVSINIFSVIASILAIMPFLFGFLLLFSSITLKFRNPRLIVHVMRVTFSVFCGMQFPLAVLPESMQTVGRWVPLTHFVSMLRGIIIDKLSLVHFLPDITFVVLSGCALLVGGILIFEQTKNGVRKRGLAAGY